MQQKVQGLKKEFSKRDVSRLRNLVKGKTGASIGTQIGYKKETKDYKEGDVWTENRKTWTIKNGIKQTVSKLDAIKKEVFMPLCCPECNKVMKKRLDKPNYKIHKKCFDCVVEFEGSLKNKGLYKDYIKDLKTNNELAILDEMESYLLNAINATNNGYVSEQGTVERWVGGYDKEKIAKDIIENSKIRREAIKNKND
jgi:hypothetical protein